MAGRTRAVGKSSPKVIKGRVRSVRKTPAIPILGDNPDVPISDNPTILPRPTKPARANERVLTYNGDGALHPVIYGEVKNIGAAVSYWKAISGNRLLVRYIIGYGPIEAITNIRVDNLTTTQLLLGSAIAHGSTAPASKGYQVFLGTNNQSVSTLFTQHREVTWVPSRAPGVAFVDILFPNYQVTDGTETIATPDITNFKCDVKGLKIRDFAQDPTLVTRFFSEDAALIMADLMTSKRYGGRIPDTQINWSHIATDVSPYIMEDLGGGVKRYPIGIVLNHQENLDVHIENIRAHAQLLIPTYNGGMYNILVDKPRAYSGIHFEDENILEGSTLTTLGSSEVFERVNITYIDSSQGWIQKSTPIELPGLSENSIPIDEKSYSLIGTRTFSQAKRIGTYLINRSILDKVINFTTNEVGKQALPGDRVKITDVELNLEAQDVIVTNINAQDGKWAYTAEIYDEDVFSSVVQTEFTEVEPAYPSPHDPPDPPTDLILTQERDGSNLRVKIEFTPAEVGYNSQFTRIKIRKNSTDPWFWLADTTDSVAYIENITETSFWEIELKTKTAAPYLLTSALLLGSITAAFPAEDITLLKGSGLHAWEIGGPTAPKNLWWDAPKIRDYTREKSDGGYTLTFGTEVGGVIKAVSAGAVVQIEIDLGAGNEKAFQELELTAPNDGSYFSSEINYNDGTFTYDAVEVMYEDTPGSFLRVSSGADFELYYPKGLTRRTDTSGGVNQTRFIKQHWNSPGVRRKWRIKLVGRVPSRVIAIENFKLSTFSDTELPIGYNLFDYMQGGGVPTFIKFIPESARPTSTNPLNITQWVQQIGTTKRASILVKTLDNFSQESDGVTYFHEFTGATELTPTFTQEVQTLEHKTLGTGSVVPWATLTGTPITLAGYGITDDTELAQDAVGSILTDTDTIDFTYNDATPTITADVKDSSITAAKLAGDVTAATIGAQAANAILDTLVAMGKPQKLSIILTNTAGTLQAAIRTQSGTAVLPTLSDKITGASATVTNLPYVTSGVDFINGLGVDNAQRNDLYLNTADQVDTQQAGGFASVVNNSTGDAVSAEYRIQSLNINGVTRNRGVLKFRYVGTGAAWNIDTTNIAAGEIIVIQMLVFMK